MRKQCIKRGMSVLSAFIIGFTTVAGLMGSGITSKAATTNISNPRIADDGTVTWDKVTFGSYYQDMNEMVAEPIKWRILSVNEDRTDAFLIADKAIDCKGYNVAPYDITWENCTLRTWLNEDFYNEAFDSNEKKLIKDSQVDNNDNPSYCADGGNNTTDKIYLLSINEAVNADYGFGDEDNRITKMTDYARMGLDGGIYNDKDYLWWLRSPAQESTSAAYVSPYGQCGQYESSGVYYTNGIRPVMHINLNSSYVNDAGKVTSDGSVILPTDSGYTSDGYVNPVTVIDGVDHVTTWDCIYFGNYKQNATFSKKPIEWRVLSVNGNDAFLLSDKVLDYRPYSTTFSEETRIETGVIRGDTWESCTLRDWLNDSTDSNSFINSAFSSNEQKAIKSTLVINDNNPVYGTEGGDNTTDKVFLLSRADVTNEKYGFFEEFSATNNLNPGRIKDRQAQTTDYAYISGEYRVIGDSADIGCGDWLLRSPGNNICYVDVIGTNGWGRDSSDWSSNSGIRPALHIDLSSANLTLSGTVKITNSEKAAAYVDELITDIGTPVTLESKDKIEKARAAYNALDNETMGKVTKYSDLTAAEYTLGEWVVAAHIDRVILGIGEVTLDSKDKIEDARKYYDGFSKSEQEKVTKYDVLTAAEAKYAELEKQDKEDTANAAKVDELISAIGEVTLDSKSRITEARTAYDALTSGAKNKVTKYDVLTAAENKLVELEAKKDSPATTEAPKTDATTEAPATTEETKTVVTDAQMKKTTPAVATVKEEKTKKGKVSITIKWKTVNGANGYKVYRSTRKNKGYKCVKTIRKAATKSWKDTGVKTGKTYYYKMRAYKKSGKKTIYSKYSSTKKIRVK